MDSETIQVMRQLMAEQSQQMVDMMDAKLAEQSQRMTDMMDAKLAEQSQRMADMMDAKLAEQSQRMTDMMDAKLEPIQQDLADVKQDLAEVKQRTTAIEVTLENDIKPQLRLLAEGQQGMNEQFRKLDQVAENVEEIKIRVSALESVTKDNTAQIQDIRLAK